MTIKTTMTRTVRLAIGTAAVLALMSQAAQARPSGVNQRTGLPVGVGVQITHLPPSGTSARTSVSPANNVAKAHGDNPTGPTTSARVVTVQASAGSFDWAAAAIGAGIALTVVLIGAAALTAHGRRRVPLST